MQTAETALLYVITAPDSSGGNCAGTRAMALTCCDDTCGGSANFSAVLPLQAIDTLCRVQLSKNDDMSVAFFLLFIVA